MSRRCRHENADHLMPGDVLTPSDYAPIEEEHPVLVEQFRCVDCGAWLPIGPATDSTIAVGIELRAAEIIADGWMLWTEALAFDCEDDSEPSGPREPSPSWRAGELARVIATHPECE